jgi:hypothetical protein
MNTEKLLKENRNAIIALTAKHGALKPRVLGSVARGEAGPQSDIDLLVKMERKLFLPIPEPRMPLSVISR